MNLYIYYSETELKVDIRKILFGPRRKYASILFGLFVLLGGLLISGKLGAKFLRHEAVKV